MTQQLQLLPDALAMREWRCSLRQHMGCGDAHPPTYSGGEQVSRALLSLFLPLRTYGIRVGSVGTGALYDHQVFAQSCHKASRGQG